MLNNFFVNDNEKATSLLLAATVKAVYSMRKCNEYELKAEASLIFLELSDKYSCKGNPKALTIESRTSQLGMIGKYQGIYNANDLTDKICSNLENSPDETIKDITLNNRQFEKDKKTGRKNEQKQNRVLDTTEENDIKAIIKRLNGIDSKHENLTEAKKSVNEVFKTIGSIVTSKQETAKSILAAIKSGKFGFPYRDFKSFNASIKDWEKKPEKLKRNLNILKKVCSENYNEPHELNEMTSEVRIKRICPRCEKALFLLKGDKRCFNCGRNIEQELLHDSEIL